MHYTQHSSALFVSVFALISFEICISSMTIKRCWSEFYIGMDSVGPLPRSESFLENPPHVHARHMEYHTYGGICLQWGGTWKLPFFTAGFERAWIKHDNIKAISVGIPIQDDDHVRWKIFILSSPESYRLDSRGEGGSLEPCGCRRREDYVYPHRQNLVCLHKTFTRKIQRTLGTAM